MSEFATVAARFRVLADAEPGLLPRLLNALAKRDLVPDSVALRREGAMFRIEVALVMPVDDVHRVEGNFAQVVGVRRLEVEQGVLRRVA